MRYVREDVLFGLLAFVALLFLVICGVVVFGDGGAHHDRPALNPRSCRCGD